MPSRGIGPEVTFGELTDILGVSNKTVHTWVKKGCPFIERGGPGREWKFNTAEVFKWVKQQEIEKALGTAAATITMDDANLRLKLATAELKEYELARIRGETVTVPDARAAYEEDLAVVRARLLAIPGRLAQELTIEGDAVKVERIIKREISEALSDLSFDPDALIERGNA